MRFIHVGCLVVTSTKLVVTQRQDSIRPCRAYGVLSLRYNYIYCSNTAPYHLTLLNHTYSYILTLTSNTCQVWITHSITEWWDQCHMFTWSCRSSAAPAFTSSETTSVLPQMAASISGECPLCVMTDMCSETLMTGREGSLHTRPSLHVWGREWYRQPSVSYVWVYNLSSGEDRTPYRTPHINTRMTRNSSEWTCDSPCPLVCKPSLGTAKMTVLYRSCSKCM